MIMKLTAALCGLLLATPAIGAEVIVLASQQDPAVVVVRGELRPGDQNTFRRATEPLKSAVAAWRAQAALWGPDWHRPDDQEAEIRDRCRRRQEMHLSMRAGLACRQSASHGGHARVGFHQPRSASTGDKVSSHSQIWLDIENYIRTVGLSHSAFVFVTPWLSRKAMEWLTPASQSPTEVPYSELERAQAFIYRVLAATPARTPAAIQASR